MAGMSRETQMSIEASSMFPGFRFSPTDSELISYYLKKKMEGAEKCVEVITEIEICKYEPWDLPGKSVIQSENEWFFFSARGRKYPNGTQSKRATELGYWKATGKERNVKSGNSVIGTKRTLVFHVGRAPKGERTEWIMHEYCMHGTTQDSLVVCRLRRNVDFRQSETSNRASPSRRPLSTTQNDSSNAEGEGGVYQIGLYEVDKNAECSKKCSSSHDSYSIEQFDSASESEQKQSNEFTLAESSSILKESDKEEDFYADILKDDIVKLDEASLYPSLPLVGSMAGVGSTPLQTVEYVTSQAVPLRMIPQQGTTNRRIKMKEKTPAMPSEDREEGTILSKPEEAPKCVVDFLAHNKRMQGYLPAICLILSLLVLSLFLLGGYQQIKNIAYKLLPSV